MGGGSKARKSTVFGFNTDVKSGDTVYHVQTEDRGEKNPVVDSVIYVKGQILDRRRTPYLPAEVSHEQLTEMVKKQHRELVDAIRDGTYVPSSSPAPAEEKKAPRSPPAFEVLNPEELEHNGRLVFRLRLPTGTRVLGCMEVEGAEKERVEAMADAEGEAELAFPLPDAPRATVLFYAEGGGARHAAKYVVRQQ